MSNGGGAEWRRNELARLDEAWERDRRPYLLYSRNGTPVVPTQLLSFIAGLALVAFGVWWIMNAQPPAGPAWFRYLGGIVILFGVGMGFHWSMLARGYQRAFERYQTARGRLLAELESELWEDSRAGPPSD